MSSALAYGDRTVTIDLDEIRPDRFVIHNDKVRPLLKGEGVTAGKFFELVTWRRAGLLARIRERGFNVRSITDRIAALPGITPVPPLGAAGVRLLTAKERIASFDRASLHWQDLPVGEHNGKAAVRLRIGEPVRRRRSRGPGDYYIITPGAADQLNLRPVSETDALLQAYALIAQSAAPAVIRCVQHPDTYHVPQRQATLPPLHRELLQLLAIERAEPWTVAQSSAALAKAVYAKLGIALEPQV